MKMVKRWGVMTLAALLVLGTMGAALADEGTAETVSEAATELPEKGEYQPVLEWPEGLEGLVAFVFYWGYGDDPAPDCLDSEEIVPTTGGGFFGFGGGLVPTAVEPVQCVQLNVEKNGHVNHGSMVSSFVHWLKDDGNLESLPEEFQDMPKGQLVKEFAHEDFGKGNFELPSEDDPAAANVEAEDADGHGQPAWVKDKKADKPGKGKNK